MSSPKLVIKRFICWLGFGDRLIEFCQDCGRKQPLVWYADDRLWRMIAGSKGGVLCPECFDHRATSIGVSITWMPKESQLK